MSPQLYTCIEMPEPECEPNAMINVPHINETIKPHITVINYNYIQIINENYTVVGVDNNKSNNNNNITTNNKNSTKLMEIIRFIQILLLLFISIFNIKYKWKQSIQC
ncbi:hypothetical protein BLOT_011235 [Blomia tropicalis]|nr:hypothetical protein BLOT_011235 [Blomia tropicalis]